MTVIIHSAELDVNNRESIGNQVGPGAYVLWDFLCDKRGRGAEYARWNPRLPSFWTVEEIDEFCNRLLGQIASLAGRATVVGGACVCQSDGQRVLKTVIAQGPRTRLTASHGTIEATLKPLFSAPAVLPTAEVWDVFPFFISQARSGKPADNSAGIRVLRQELFAKYQPNIQVK